jgi:hypothetical protein
MSVAPDSLRIPVIHSTEFGLSLASRGGMEVRGFRGVGDGLAAGSFARPGGFGEGDAFEVTSFGETEAKGDGDPLNPRNFGDPEGLGKAEG